MPEDIDKTIYKLELDPSSYISGVDKAAASTNKLSIAQENANKILEDNKKALASQSEYLQQAKKDLDSYSGTNEKYRQQLLKSFQSAQADNLRLTDIVNKSKAAYDQANQSATNFANTASRATNLQTAPGARIPTTVSGAVPAQISSQIASIINIPDFAAQTSAVQQTKAEFDDLTTSIGLAEARMNQLNSTDEEFKQLAPIVEKGKEALLAYNVAVHLAGDSHDRLRTQILQGRDALSKMEATGQQSSEQYVALRTHVAQLTQEYRVAEQEIQVLSSQTRVFDFGKAGVEAAINGFQVYTAISVLAGGASEELQKKTIQLFAAMQLVTALEQLSNSIRKGSIITTNLQSASTAAYTAVVGASTGALKAFRIALAATGIGAALVIIGLLVERWNDLKEKQKEVELEQKSLLDINKKAVDSFGEEVTHLNLLKGEYDNVNTSAKRRKEIQDELQKSYPNYFKDLDTHADKEKYIAEQIDKVSQALILQAEIQAAQSLLAEKFKTLLKEQFDPSEAVSFFDVVKDAAKNAFSAPGKLATDLGKTASKNLKQAQDDYNKFSKFIQNFVNDANTKLDLLGGDPYAHTGKETKTIQDDFLVRKAALLEEMAKLHETEFQSELNLSKEYDTKLKKALAELKKDKELKPSERKELIQLTTQLNTDQLKQAIDELRKKVRDAEQKLNEELRNLQQKANEDTLNLIQDEFDRRKKLIEFNQSKDISDANEYTEKYLKQLESKKKVGIITEQDYQHAKEVIVATGEQNINNIIAKYARDRQALAFDMIIQLADDSKKLLESEDLGLSRISVIEINKQNDLLAKRKISFETYEKNITKIAKDEADKRNEYELKNLRANVNRFRQELVVNNDKLTESEKQQLLDKIREDEQKIADLEKGNVDPKSKGKIDSVAAYASAIGDVAASVIQFWQAANDAESRALDRSIALQQTRVDQAQRIADRGNAQYLKAEEDRLTQLNIARENAARQQLGIDAALQGSQILVGITGAIAKIATPGIGVAETISEIAVIIGALGTGYALVKSLQSNQPKLAKGDPFVSRGTNPAGIDTIPAWLNEGEAVIPTNKNKAYHPTVRAIYDGTIPADHLNNFVKNYHRIKSIPQVDHNKIKEVAELHIGENGRMAVLLTEQNQKLSRNNELQELTLRAMKNMSVSAIIDKDGIAISVNEYIEKMNIDKKI